MAPGLSKLSEREDHSSQKRVEFPGLEEQGAEWGIDEFCGADCNWSVGTLSDHYH